MNMLNTHTHEQLPPEALQMPKRRGRPVKEGWTVKKCRARIKELGAKPYGKDCLKLKLPQLIAYVEDLEKTVH
jgi:hypothetical protein